MLAWQPTNEQIDCSMRPSADEPRHRWPSADERLEWRDDGVSGGGLTDLHVVDHTHQAGTLHAVYNHQKNALSTGG